MKKCRSPWPRGCRHGAVLLGAVLDRLGLEQKAADAVSAEAERTGRTMGNVDYRII
jgi:hypothetical protein